MRPTSVIRNSLFVLVARVCELGAGFLTIGLATRYLGPKVFGEYALIGTTVVTLSPMVALGVARILVRDVAVNVERGGTLVASALLLNSLLAFPALAIGVVAVWLAGLHSPYAMVAVAVATGAQVMTILQQTAGAVFVARERMAYDPVMTIVTRLLLLGLFVTVVWMRQSYTSFFLASALAAGVGLWLAVHILTTRFVKPVWGVRGGELAYLAGQSVPVAVYNFLGASFVFVNVYFLKHYQGLEQVSLFQAPQRVIGPLMMFPMAVLFAFTPALFRMGADAAKAPVLRKTYEMAMRHILALVLPVCIGVSWFAGPVVRLLFGAEFVESAGSFRLLFWIILPFGLNALLNTLLTGLHKQRGLIVTHVAALVINLVLAPVLIGRWGHVGASAAMLVSVVALFLMNHGYLGLQIGRPRVVGIVIRNAPSSLAAVAVLAGLDGRAGDWLAGAVALLVYVVLTVLFGAVRIEDLRSVVRSAGRKDGKDSRIAP